MTERRDGGWYRATQNALALIFGSPCVVCDDPNGPVCGACIPVPDVQHRVLPGALECFAGARWDAETATLMLALKQDGVTRVARVLAPLLTTALGSVPSTSLAPVLVPVPTRAAADRRRGYRPVEVLLNAASLPFQRAMRVTRTVRDQRELGREERARNTQGAFAVRRTTSILAPVILVDDVVTTGATLANSAQTLRSAGIDVVACITVLTTPKRLVANS